MDFSDLIARFGLALGIGLLIGLERGWRMRGDAPGSRTAGIRTFAISGLLGGVTGALALTLGGRAGAGGGLVIGIGFAAYAAVMTVFFSEENRADKQFSATTAVAAMTTFALGVYALLGDMHVAAGLAVATAAILALREPLHGWVRNITWDELRSGLVLLAMTFIALPIVPNEPIGPFGGVNLREVWLIAIVLALVSFVGYAAVKYFGSTSGVLLASAAGGLVSSTAVMVTNARRAAGGEGAAQLLAAGAMLATAVSIGRTCAIVAALNTAVLHVVVVPLMLAALASALAAGLLAWGAPAQRRDGGQLFRNPFELIPVIGFALLIAAMLVVARIAADYFGAAGVMVAALVTGLADVDAATVSVAKLPPTTLGAQDAGMAVLLAVAANSLSKAAIGRLWGRGAFGMRVAAGTVAALAAGGLGLVLAAVVTG